MKFGFSTLSLFMKSFDEICKIAIENNFEMIEILGDGPYNPNNLLSNKELLEPLFSYDLEINIHAPTVDLNLASLNEGIKKESIRQIKQTLDLGDYIGANFITVHPGQIGRSDERFRKVAIEYSIDSIKECVEYGENLKTKISVENMPNNFKFLGTTPHELETISNKTNSHITIDTGHCNTCPNTPGFFNLDNISYFHIHDNNGDKDQHLVLGEGNLDLNLLKKVKIGSIELNNFENVLKSKKVLKNLFQ
ncbi:sugar phosphate isomerase/epimerase family protein [Methanobrevibacter sp. DSM 116169]|uniref:sugar phosphate isomerase/epimerase family protein n=1 Tax=Methanobrevibacter sp. DSM 116169 TaxID=3242727 RepID=UPI0038FCE0B8